MAKRPGLLDSIDMGKGQGSAPEATSIVKMPVQERAATPKNGNVKTSLYLPPQAHRKLKEIAFAKDCKVHDLVIEGINQVLAENGFPAVHELAK